jgi:hypothetical protein
MSIAQSTSKEHGRLRNRPAKSMVDCAIDMLPAGRLARPGQAGTQIPRTPAVA